MKKSRAKRMLFALSATGALALTPLSAIPIIPSAQAAEKDTSPTSSVSTENAGTAADSSAESKSAEKLVGQFEVTNPKKDGSAFEPGEVIRYNLTVTNNTDMTRSFKAISSNLENWDGCKWSALAKGNTQSCPFAYHTVTDADAKAGSFTPSITFARYNSTGYTGSFENLAPLEGARVEIATPLFEVQSFSFTEGTGKEKYSVGDKLTATLVIRNTSQAPLTLGVDGAKPCSATVPAGKTHTCTFPHTVTKDDLERAQAEYNVVVKATQGQRNATKPAKATTSTPTQWERAKSFAASNADPRLEADLSQLQVIGVNTPEYNIRIPAIAVASNGDLLASWDLRPTNGVAKGGDSPNENSIVQRRSHDGGKTWGPVTTIAQGKVAPAGQRYGYSDPSYVVDHTTGEIFNFHVGSMEAGFPNNPSYRLNEDGTVDEKHRQTMNLAVSSSTDNGYTWSHRIITNDILGSEATKFDGCFATSGAGTQKMQAPYKGRLLQQVACRKADRSGNLAVTIFSDDHGKTWQRGNFTSDTEGAAQGKKWNYDENKVTELSDGRLMLNSRIPRGSAEEGYRMVAVSNDGGMNWSEYRADHNLLDSQNNAQILRAFPTAKKGTLRGKVLLFSNTKNHWDRVDGHVSMSYDDGATWPVSKQIRKGGTGYTTMAVQPDGRIGLLLEPDTWNKIGYVNFSLKYLTDRLPFEVALDDIKDISLTDGKEMTPHAFTSTGNDPLLADTFTFTGLPQGLRYDAQSGKLLGTPNVGNAQTKAFNVTVTLTEEDDGTGIARTSTKNFTIKVEPNEEKPAPKSPDSEEAGAPAPGDPAPTPTPGDPAPTPAPGASGKPGEKNKNSAPQTSPAPQAKPLPFTGVSATLLAFASIGSVLSGIAVLRRRS
ncbi:exo-alpha-sialidase [Arcanobacterium canis]|uniref:exo-alpha-sialidase n=1 Tax=Arcanobacterium canis TaxID=999183 RepID=A0ABY8G1E2_9ACTO|nr:exo-alpha-sialidase [Arcanobacterium canis]WFM83231.1 exo-alpha-sialidase [Arcanobacterium canis]